MSDQELGKLIAPFLDWLADHTGVTFLGLAGLVLALVIRSDIKQERRHKQEQQDTPIR